MVWMQTDEEKQKSQHARPLSNLKPPGQTGFFACARRGMVYQVEVLLQHRRVEEASELEQVDVDSVYI